MKTINIFCIMGKIKSGKEFYLSKILSDKKFVEKSNLKLLIYGTTRKNGTNKNRYTYISEKEFNKINPTDIIESRSYFTIPEGNVYYFTSINHINIDKNNICIVSPYQYENYKKWTTIENLKCPGKYSLHLILIDADINIRMSRAIKNIQDEEEMCELARRIIQDKNEFDDVKIRIPQLLHPTFFKDLCYINNNENYYTNLDIINNITKIKNYILDNSK